MAKQERDTLTPTIEARKRQAAMADADEIEQAYDHLETAGKPAKPAGSIQTMSEPEITPETICIKYTGGAPEMAIAHNRKGYLAHPASDMTIEVPYKFGKALADAPDAPWREVPKPANHETKEAIFDDKYGRVHAPILTEAQVTRYLDDHPAFLDEYVKKKK